MKVKKNILIGLLISLIYLVINLFIINDYGISWDFHYHHFAGMHHLGQKVPSIDEPSNIPFTPPDPRLTTDDPFGPFVQILPTSSYLFFYDKLHLLPFDSAYNLPSVFMGSLGVLILFLFINEAVNFPVAVFSAIFLALLPTHFGYLHNNMKDVPNAFAFTLAIYLFWRLTRYKRKRDLIFAVISFAFAFNVKINSVMVPVVCLIWFMFNERKQLTQILKNKLVILYFILSPLAATAVWWPFWKDPLGKLLQLPYFYSHNTINMPVLFLGKILHSAVNIPWYYPWVYIFITTPLGILFSFLIGILVSLTRFFRKNEIYSLVIIWLFVPLLRYLSPKASAIDGMRHFMEIIYPLCVLAGMGFFTIYNYLNKLTKQKNIGLIVFSIIAITLVYNLVKFHPYQASFYNALTGGIKGANGKFDIDFWGVPQKDAMNWLNKNAMTNSYIHIVMAQSSAAMYARPDLQDKINKKGIEDSNYTLILNKKSFFEVYPVGEYLEKSLRGNKLAYAKTIDGVALFWIIKN